MAQYGGLHCNFLEGWSSLKFGAGWGIGRSKFERLVLLQGLRRLPRGCNAERVFGCSAQCTVNTCTPKVRRGFVLGDCVGLAWQGGF